MWDHVAHSVLNWGARPAALLLRLLVRPCRVPVRPHLKVGAEVARLTAPSWYWRVWRTCQETLYWSGEARSSAAKNRLDVSTRCACDESRLLLAHAGKKAVAVPRHSLPDARRAIEAEQLDVWVMTEVGLDFLSYELAFARLAPNQVLIPGHYSSSGIDTVDYFVSYAPQEHREDGALKVPQGQSPQGLGHLHC